MLAVIKTGGKQYLVTPGQKIRIEKMDPHHQKIDAGASKKEDQEIIFDEVLLLEKGGKVEIGSPLVKDAKVIGKIIHQGKAKKVIVFKYKPKTRYKVKKGHRQPFTEVEILKISNV
ncbi:MAG: 50S ribosomal protein L21 [Candidatus Portnoybacteria bacterium CG_4_10_14_0_8_um_filter_40_50]|uniref:Large ribosomal subunit protein bL21 n=1 Tax=Candidatus Portnoybacteria bacterium CG_4_10_14_0_8_um_filter_40_50 TaxID=1974800 RepID=A0A2M7QQJ7_9BACT|nr:MAG: 50S ribosomal protein L21 [Candidatus Portnoybacteria bacterium CG_4_10_14_0_8_um_filter_40_50]